MESDLYAVFDVKAQYYHSPVPAREGLIKRSFTDAVNNEGTEFNKYPEDFILYKIGTYDTSTAKINSLSTPEPVLRAIDCLKVVPLRKGGKS